MKTNLPALPICILAFVLMSLPLGAAGAQPPPQPTPTVDRLAIPTLPANPTQLDVGKSLYYYNCMPCHGDYGQGLTDEFREIWEEDHQNCWGRGCHSGRPGEEGFPIPTTIPAVNIAAVSEQHFPSAENLYEYLRKTHPPQNPGVLKDEEYAALAEFTLSLAGRQETATKTGENGLSHRVLAEMGLGVLVLGTILFVAATFRWGKPQ